MFSKVISSVVVLFPSWCGVVYFPVFVRYLFCSDLLRSGFSVDSMIL
jgi:hypothetical protein